MNVLVINSGSSSIKFQLINMKTKEVLAKGIVERIGLDGSKLKYLRGDNEKIEDNREINDHEEGIELIVKYLTSDLLGVIKDIKQIYAVGHRVVHAGEKFKSTVIIDDEVMNALKECIPLAPLHNPANIIGIEATMRKLPGIPMAGVFDTAFHQTMPEKAFIYALPYELYESDKIRRYGFHGTSHFFVAKKGAKFIGKKMEELKIITCHLGNGSSIAAIEYGKSIDTSMGFTPLEGLVMGTRSGDIDPAIPMYLQRNKKMTYFDVDTLLNKKSGILGISGISSDLRDIEEAVEKGDKRAKLSLEIFTYRIKKYIGSYIAVMNGVDLIIFTAGIGENGPIEREMILKDMEFFGIKLDKKRNNKIFKGKKGLISADDSKIKVMVCPTNEELEIAEQTLEIIKSNKK